MATGGPKATWAICTDGFCRKSYEPCIYFLCFIFVQSFFSYLSFHVYLRLFSFSSIFSFSFSLFPCIYTSFFVFFPLSLCLFLFVHFLYFFFLFPDILLSFALHILRSFSLFLSHHLFITFCFSPSFCSPLSPFPFVLRISSSPLFLFFYFL